MYISVETPRKPLNSSLKTFIHRKYIIKFFKDYDPLVRWMRDVLRGLENKDYMYHPYVIDNHLHEKTSTDIQMSRYRQCLNVIITNTSGDLKKEF